MAPSPRKENVAFELEALQGEVVSLRARAPLGWGERVLKRSPVPGQEVLGFNESDNDCFITVRAILIERTHFSCY